MSRNGRPATQSVGRKLWAAARIVSTQQRATLSDQPTKANSSWLEDHKAAIQVVSALRKQRQ